MCYTRSKSTRCQSGLLVTIARLNFYTRYGCEGSHGFESHTGAQQTWVRSLIGKVAGCLYVVGSNPVAPLACLSWSNL